MKVLRKCLAHAAVLALCLGAALPARAQEDAIFRDGLISLSRTLGAVHYLRPLCRPSEGQMWRNKMLALLSDGAVPAGQREAMIAAFNQGYAQQQRAHSRCTPAVANLANTYARQGSDQAASLARRL